MTPLDGIRARLLQKQSLKERPAVAKRGCRPDEAYHLGLLLDGRQAAYVEFAARYAESQRAAGRTVDVLAYLPKIPKAGFPLPCFSRRDLNWYFKPVRGEAVVFLRREFDMLLHLTPNPVPPLEYLCGVSLARYVVGNGTRHLTDNYDCLIMVNDEDNPASFMENVFHYLTLQT